VRTVRVVHDRLIRADLVGLLEDRPGLEDVTEHDDVGREHGGQRGEEHRGRREADAEDRVPGEEAREVRGVEPPLDGRPRRFAGQGRDDHGQEDHREDAQVADRVPHRVLGPHRGEPAGEEEEEGDPHRDRDGDREGLETTSLDEEGLDGGDSRTHQDARLDGGGDQRDHLGGESRRTQRDREDAQHELERDERMHTLLPLGER